MFHFPIWGHIKIECRWLLSLAQVNDHQTEPITIQSERKRPIYSMIFYWSKITLRFPNVFNRTNGGRIWHWDRSNIRWHHFISLVNRINAWKHFRRLRSRRRCRTKPTTLSISIKFQLLRETWKPQLATCCGAIVQYLIEYSKWFFSLSFEETFASFPFIFCLFPRCWIVIIAVNSFKQWFI